MGTDLGHVKTIRIRNLSNFDSLDLDGPLGASVALVGNTNTGKTTLLELLSAVNVFRPRFVLNEEGTGLCRLVNASNSGQQPSVWDIVSGETEPDVICSFEKTNPTTDSLFLVEAVGQKKTIYYGLYATEEEKEWSWNREIGRYSTAFVLHANHLFVLDPTALLHKKSSKLIIKYELPSGTSRNRSDFSEDVHKWLLQHSKKGVSEASSDTFLKAVDELDHLPTNIMCLLPSVCMEDNKSKTHCKTVDFIAQLLTRPADIHTRCLLLDNPYSCVNIQSVKQSLDELTAANIQVILTTYSEAALREKCFASVIRMFKIADGLKRGVKVPDSFLNYCSEKKWDALEILTSSKVLCVEGPSDVNVLGSFMVKATSKPEKIKESFNLDNDKKIIKQLLQGTFVFDVDGKGNFHKVTHLFLEQAHLCLFPFIVCDGDALYGGSAEAMRGRQNNIYGRQPTPIGAQSHGSQDMPETMEWQPSQGDGDSACSTSASTTEPPNSDEQRERSNYRASSILGDAKTSVLYHCIQCLKQAHPHIVSLYGELCNAAFQQRTLGDVLGIQYANVPHQVQEKLNLPDLVNCVIRHNCKNDEEAREFAKTSLHTLAWHAPEKHDLESVIAITPGIKHIPSKRKLRTDKALGKSIADLMLMNGNTAIEELLHHLFTDFWPRVDTCIGTSKDRQDNTTNA